MMTAATIMTAFAAAVFAASSCVQWRGHERAAVRLLVAGWCVAAALFVWKLVPETKGKTLEDMSNLWKKKK